MKLSYTEYEVINSALMGAFGRGIKVCDMNGCKFGKEPMKFGVNWAALGTTAPEESMEYARDLTIAAHIAFVLTNAQIEVDYSEEVSLTEDEYAECLEIMERMRKEFSKGCIAEFVAYTNKVGK